MIKLFLPAVINITIYSYESTKVYIYSPFDIMDPTPTCAMDTVAVATL